jgi:hypothetical protein
VVYMTGTTMTTTRAAWKIAIGLSLLQLAVRMLKKKFGTSSATPVARTVRAHAPDTVQTVHTVAAPQSARRTAARKAPASAGAATSRAPRHR